MSTETRTANAKHIFIDIVSYTHKRSVEAQSDLIKTLNEIVCKVIESKKIPSENIIFIPTGDGMCISLNHLTFTWRSLRVFFEHFIYIMKKKRIQ